MLTASRSLLRTFARRSSNAPLTVETINPSIVKAQYAVRGELILRAGKIKEELAAAPGSKPFAKLTECNIGNPQAVGQQPLSFNREVLAILVMPSLLEKPEILKTFAPDAVERAKEYLAAIPSGVGAYSESQGFGLVRQQVADFITERDGIPADKDDIFLTDGASKGVGFMLDMVLRGSSDGVMVPIPQYPLYSASLALAEAHMLGYELDEANDWSMPIDQLEQSLQESIAKGITPRALVVINPGNPTGNSLPLENMKDVVRFCSKHNLVLMADEVYQENIYDSARPFYSFKKVRRYLPLHTVTYRHILVTSTPSREGPPLHTVTYWSLLLLQEGPPLPTVTYRYIPLHTVTH